MFCQNSAAYLNVFIEQVRNMPTIARRNRYTVNIYKSFLNFETKLYNEQTLPSAYINQKSSKQQMDIYFVNCRNELRHLQLSSGFKICFALLICIIHDIYTQTYTHTHIHMNTHIYTHKHAHTYTHTHTNTHAHARK